MKTDELTKEELAAIIKQRKAECQKQLRLLYSAFNKTEATKPDMREIVLGEAIEEQKEQLQILKDRQDVIGREGHNRFCPCCGLKLPRGYFKKLVDEVKSQEQSVAELESEYSGVISARECGGNTALTEEIARIESTIAEIEKWEKEAKEIGLI